MPKSRLVAPAQLMLGLENYGQISSIWHQLPEDAKQKVVSILSKMIAACVNEEFE